MSKKNSTDISWDRTRELSICQPYAQAAFTPRKCSWYSFLSTPEPQCDRKDFMSMKNSNDTSWNRTSDLPICQPYAPAAFNPRKRSWYSFLLHAESTPGPDCDRKNFMSMKNSNDTRWNRTSDLPICQPYAQATFTPKKYSWYSFLLEAESTPGP